MSLRENCDKLLDDVSGLFENEDIDTKEFKDDTKFIGENDKRLLQHRHGDNEEDDVGVIDHFISFPTDSRSSNSDKEPQYPQMGNASSEDDKLYDETALNQDYEPVTFSE